MTKSDPTNAARKHRMRQARKDKGLREVRLWLEPDDVWRFCEIIRMKDRDREEAVSFMVQAGFEKAMSER